MQMRAAAEMTPILALERPGPALPGNLAPVSVGQAREPLATAVISTHPDPESTTLTPAPVSYLKDSFSISSLTTS